jgi:Domain of unknown function DUF29
MPDDLYHTDILGWSKAQAERLRRVAAGERVNDVDWEHVLEEIEDVGKSELKTVRSHLRNALIHALKVLAWPDHSASRKWRNEIRNFLSEGRGRYEPGMAQHLDLPELYAAALEHVRDTSMPVPPRPLPEVVELRPADIIGRDVKVDDLLARLRAALPPA